MYLKILRFRGDRAICATDIGKDLDVRRTLLPVTVTNTTQHKSPLHCVSI